MEPSKIARFINKCRRKSLSRLKARLLWKKEAMDLKAKMQKNSHSLLWVWEFCKKAVIICFLFYIIVQVYSMIVMAVTGDYTALGDLITETASITKECVFGYMIKAGVENVCKIVFPQNPESDEEAVG